MNYVNITKIILLSLLLVLSSCETETGGIKIKDTDNPAPKGEINIQMGSSYNDLAVDLAKDSQGNVYVLSRWGQINDETKNLFLSDLKLTKLNKDSEEIWSKVFAGTDGEDTSIDIPSKLVIDKSDNVYMFGITLGSIGEAQSGPTSFDAFFIKVDEQGKEITKKQWGSTSSDLVGSAVIDDDENIYVIGDTHIDFNTGNRSRTPNIFITKINNKDEIVWTKHHQSDGYELISFASINGSDIYITGQLENLGSTASKDCFLLKFNEETGFKEISILETDRKEYIKSINVDKTGNIYLAGYTEGDLSSVIPNKDGDIESNGKTGVTDMFVLKLNDDGIKGFKQWGTTGRDEATAITTDKSGNIYIAGTTNKNNPPQNTDDTNTYLVKMDKDFNELWSKNKLAEKRTDINSILLDEARIYITGSTLGSFEGYENQGGYDVFVTGLDNKE